MKVLVGLNNKNILDYLEFTNSFIIGLKDFSINYQEYTLDEIKELKSNYPYIELFVSINKNIFNDDLDILLNYLKELSDGIIYDVVSNNDFLRLFIFILLVSFILTL